MNTIRAKSSPELLPPSAASELRDFTNLEGVAATVKLLLKLIEDHKDACGKEKNDSRRMLRVAGIMTILENIKNRIQTSQSFGQQKANPELRRCDSEHQKPSVPRDNNKTIEEIAKLKKELSASQAARKSLEIMCSSLGKEKEIMASELARKVHELNEMEELVSALKAQNEKLRAKVQDNASAAEANKGKKSNVGGVDLLTQVNANAALQERNKMLSEQVLRSIDGCRSAKRKLRDAQEENSAIRATMNEMGAEVGAGLGRLREFKQRMAARGTKGESVNIEREISELEQIFECFEMKVSKHGSKKGECVKPKGGHINSCKPVLA